MAKRPDPSEREQRRIARDYEARQALHARQTARRRRDNWLGITASVVVIGLAILGVWSYSAWGPGQPAPTPSASSTPGPTETPTAYDDAQNVGAPDRALAEDRTWTGTLTLNEIPLGVELDGALAPQAVAGIVRDVQDGYYVGKSCHRLATDPGFELLQCGSVDGTGAGDSSYSYGPIENAPDGDLYPAGTIAMARQGGNAYSNGHQFFLVTADTVIPSDSAGGYTVVGRVTSGLEALRDAVVLPGIDPNALGADGTGAPLVPTTITAFTIQ